MKKYFFFILGFLFSQIHFAIAYEVVSPTPYIPSTDAPTTFIANIISIAIGITGVLGVIGITWAGIQLILASGEEEKIKKARRIIIFCGVGVILAGMAYPMVNIISNFKF